MRARKRSLAIGATSVNIEEPFLEALHAIAVERDETIASLVAEAARREKVSLASALRLFVLHHYRTRAVQQLH